MRPWSWVLSVYKDARRLYRTLWSLPSFVDSPMTLPRFPLPEVDWSITLPETLEFHEQHNADVPLYMLARHELEGPSHISYGQFARACRGVPRLLGLSKEEMAARPVIAILANTDTLIYHTILLGLMLAGAIVRVHSL